MVNRLGVVIWATAVMLSYALFVAAPVAAQSPSPLDVVSDIVSEVRAPDWRYSIGVKKFFNSFTSYQFPNPFPPNQDPLSRLEFPIDQWFFGGDYEYLTRFWSARFESWVNINKESRSRMQDSDWDHEDLPFQKTIFSESNCRLNSGWLFDLRILLNPELSIFKTARPTMGVRYQTFSFTTHDGYQVSLDGSSTDLTGDGIDFNQTFYQYYLGLAIQTQLNTSGIFRRFPTTDLEVAVDYALVTAKNQDLHLLRSGQRITVENTSGHCWHLGATASWNMRRNLKAMIDVDFKRIVTNGGHQLTNSLFNVDFSFDGSKVWSDQFSVTASTELIFW
jgi:hypothetical protein